MLRFILMAVLLFSGFIVVWTIFLIYVGSKEGQLSPYKMTFEDWIPRYLRAWLVGIVLLGAMLMIGLAT